jgi:hypothetical protein
MDTDAIAANDPLQAVVQDKAVPARQEPSEHRSCA